MGLEYALKNIVSQIFKDDLDVNMEPASPMHRVLAEQICDIQFYEHNTVFVPPFEYNYVRDECSEMFLIRLSNSRFYWGVMHIFETDEYVVSEDTCNEWKIDEPEVPGLIKTAIWLVPHLYKLANSGEA